MDKFRVAQNRLVRDLVAKLDRHSPGQGAHADRVSVYSTAIGERLGFREHELRRLAVSSTLHDIGKLNLEPDLLARQSEVAQHERALFQRHIWSFEPLIDHIEDADPNLIRFHHERWDGSGYPEGLSGESIPLGSRIIAVAEAFDAMAFAYPWWAKSPDEAVATVEKDAGRQFDPAVVEALLAVNLILQPLP